MFFSYSFSFIKQIRKWGFFLFCILSGQNIYQGEITFDYNGTVDGFFSSTVDDTLITGVSFNQNIGDTTFFLIASISQQDDNEFDLFLAVLRDTTFPVQPRIWDIPGEGDDDNPLSLESIIIFMPALDSSFVNQLFETFTDTSTTGDTTDILEDVFSELSNDLYLGLEGELEITIASDSLIVGVFNTVMIKPAFYFPPHTVSIDNGEFYFNNVNIPELNTTIKNTLSPTSLKLYPAYPNPFNPITTIQYYHSGQLEFVSLFIYDINGKKLEMLYEGKPTMGINKIQWKPNKLPSGVYFVGLKTNSSIKSQKLILIK